MTSLTITFDLMDSTATKAQLLRELAAIIGESNTKELDRPDNNWNAEYSTIQIRTN